MEPLYFTATEKLPTKIRDAGDAAGFIFPLVVRLVLFARHRLYAAMSVGLMGIFFIIIGLRPLMAFQGSDESDLAAEMFFVVAICMLPVILLSVAPARAVSRRLIFLAIGLLLLIALNELSKFGFDVTAPKLQG